MPNSPPIDVKYIITDDNITVNFNGQTHIVSRSSPLADKLITAIKTNKKEDIPSLVSVAAQIKHFSKGDFEVVNGDILVKGKKVSALLGKKILQFSKEGLPHQPLVKFAEKLQANPSFRAVTELYGFLDKNNHPLTEDGDFIAYKRVRSTFMDIHSNTMDNSVGKIVELPRNEVNEDSSQECSYGLHVANWDYAHNHFASGDADTDIMLEVSVNSADVVAIPSTYNGSKMRVCKYKVLGVVKEELSNTNLRKNDSEPTSGSGNLRSAQASTEADYNAMEHEEWDDEDDELTEEEEDFESFKFRWSKNGKVEINADNLEEFQELVECWGLDACKEHLNLNSSVDDASSKDKDEYPWKDEV